MNAFKFSAAIAFAALASTSAIAANGEAGDINTGVPAVFTSVRTVSDVRAEAVQAARVHDNGEAAGYDMTPQPAFTMGATRGQVREQTLMALRDGLTTHGEM